MEQFIFNAASLASIYIGFALGLALIFGVMRTLNMAHGELLMLGGFTLYFVNLGLAPLIGPIPAFVVAIVAGFALIGLLGWALQVSLFRALGGNAFSVLMGTLAFSYSLQSLVVLFVGSQGRTVAAPLKGFYFSGTLVAPYQRVVIIVCMILAVTALWYFLMHTRTGRSIRAVAQDTRGAMLQGVSLSRVGAITMAVGAGLAGVSGVFIGSINPIDPFMGVDALWRAFIIIIVGGVGSIPGAVLAAVLFALLDSALIAVGYGKMVIMVDALVMLLVLAVRPNGLMGERDRAGGGQMAEQGMRRLPAAWGPAKILAIGGLFAFMIFAVSQASSYYQSVLILFVINCIIVLSYRTTTTMGGWSFAHMAITGLGAYTMAILTQSGFGWSVWATLPLAILLSGLFAAMIAVPVLRTKGFYFFLSTFAAGEALRQGFQQFSSLTGGLAGITFIPRPDPLWGISFETPVSFFILCLAFLAVSALFLIWLDRSRIGRTIGLVASNEELSLALGINAHVYRSVAFVAGAMVTGAAGVLLASYNGFINPLDFGVNTMFKVLSAAIIGGTSTIWGPVLGLLYITIVEESLRSYAQFIPLFYGASVIAVLVFIRGGLEQVVLSQFDHFGTRRRTAVALEDDNA